MAMDAKRTNTSPFPEVVCLAGDHFNFTLTSIEEGSQESSTFLDVAHKQVAWFVDQTNSNVMHATFDHGRDYIHLVHVDARRTH